MNGFENSVLRLEELQRKKLAVPGWAKAEQMEQSVPLCALWNIKEGREPHFCRLPAQLGALFRRTKRK